MSLVDRINEDLKSAMKAKDQGRLRGLRAIKSAILLLKTESSEKVITEDDEIKLLQKLVKQRKDSIEIYLKEGRSELAKDEEEELIVIQHYLPEQIGEEELKIELEKIVKEVGALNMKDVGKVMPIALKKFAGVSDGKTISNILRNILQ